MPQWVRGAEWLTMAHLTPRQERAIAALLTAPDQSAAATAAGIGRRTLTRWMADAAFREAYREASARRLWDTIGLLRATSADALATLRTALQSNNEHVKVRAAVALLEIAVKVETDELSARVALLEDYAKTMQDHATRTPNSHA
jgi:hypothetical protein